MGLGARMGKEKRSNGESAMVTLANTDFRTKSEMLS